MSLPASLAYRDLLWIAIPGALIVILFSPLVDLQLHAGDIAGAILAGVIIGYVLNYPLGLLSDAIYKIWDSLFKHVSSRYREVSAKKEQESSKWDFAKLETKLTTDEKQYFWELDGYYHLYRYMSTIFLVYAVYCLFNVVQFGMASLQTILGFQLFSAYVALSSVVFAFFTWNGFRSYSNTITDLYLLYAAKYDVKKGT
jgi:hypothetical protein